MRVLSRDEKAIIFLDGFEYIEYKHKKAMLVLLKLIYNYYKIVVFCNILCYYNIIHKECVRDSPDDHTAT